MFALAAIPLMLVAAAMLTYSNDVRLRAEVQEVADAAALAATTALATGQAKTNAEAEAVANKYFRANAPTPALSEEAVFSVVSTGPDTGGANNDVSTVVTFSGPMPSAFGNVTGSKSVRLDVSATSVVSVAGGPAPQGVTGIARVHADPIVTGANSKKNWTIKCPKGDWLNMLSDSGIEVNGGCADGIGQYFSDIGVVTRTHKILVQKNTAAVLAGTGP